MALPSPYRQLPLAIPASASDHADPLALARIALAAADHAADSTERHRATVGLAMQLVALAHARGRHPVPKPGQGAPGPASTRP